MGMTVFVVQIGQGLTVDKVWLMKLGFIIFFEEFVWLNVPFYFF